MIAIERLAQLFAGAGHSLYLVGGSVRDELIDLPVHDYDFTTDAEPDVIKHLLGAANADGIYTVGERFGTVGAIFGEARFEITTYRSEAYTAGSRKPRVVFGTDLEADLARRTSP